MFSDDRQPVRAGPGKLKIDGSVSVPASCTADSVRTYHPASTPSQPRRAAASVRKRRPVAPDLARHTAEEDRSTAAEDFLRLESMARRAGGIEGLERLLGGEEFADENPRTPEQPG